MSTPKRIFTSLAIGLFVLKVVAAQEQSPAGSNRSTITVTAAATADRVRFTAPSTVVQMRLEVYGANGEKLFDNEIRGGNVIDWHLQNGQAERLSDGSYLCVVTSKSISGRMSQKLGQLAIENAAASVQALDTAQLTAQQTQAVGPLEENASLTVVKEDEPQTGTVIAHNGNEGQLIRGLGALSFRVGDFFRGKDTEQMRLTAEGNLGIGIANPAAKLDVDGMIRASQGITFPDGSIQYSAARRTMGAASSRPDETGQKAKPGEEHIEPQAAGSGTSGKIAKWIDGAGTLGDSVVTDTGHLTIDSSGNMQAAGTGTLIIQGNVNKERVELRSAGAVPGPALQGKGYGGTIASPTATVANTDLFIIAGSGHNGSGLVTFNAGTIKIKAEENWTGTANGAYINFETTPSGSPTGARTERMRITGNGNVGIGTASPGAPLEARRDGNISNWQSAQVRISGATDPRMQLNLGYDTTNNRGVIQAGQATVAFKDLVVNPFGGNVGIGTTAPGAPLDVQVAAGQSFQFRQDSGLVPGINVKTTGGLAGIMRLRNVLEVWPSDDATRAGKVDVRNTAGSPTISLDGQTGNLSVTGVASFRNLPGIDFSQAVNSGNFINPGLSPVDIDSVTINAPAAGYIFVSAFVYAFTPSSTDHLFDFTLLNGGAFVVNSKSQVRVSTSFISDGEAQIHLSWVIPVSSAGALQLSTVLYYDDFGSGAGPARVRNHNLTAVYLPVQY